MRVTERVEDVLRALEAFVESEGFRGYDPFDGLNSPLSRYVTGKNRLSSLVWLQLLKRSPINLRPVLRVPKVHNPKGMALFLEAFILKHRMLGDQESLVTAGQLAGWLLGHSCKGYRGMCWGYPFPWANREFYAPRGTPNVVVTVFCANALLSFFSLTRESRYLKAARSSCDFIASDLNKNRRGEAFCFSYTPLDRRCVHNANMMAAALLARVGRLTDDGRYRDWASQSMAYSIQSQRPDGSWPYEEGRGGSWIDSFHTGYSLAALSTYIKDMGVAELRAALLHGLSFYKRYFFLPGGTVKFYHDRAFPLDAHAFAQAILCLCEVGAMNEPQVPLDAIVRRLIALFWNGRDRFFYLKQRLWTIKIPYMRWVQAWIFLALWRFLWENRSQEELTRK